MSNIYHLKTVSEALKAMGLPSPKHPLISFFYHTDPQLIQQTDDIKFSADLYLIAMKDGVSGESGYGRSIYDFREGTMMFVKPNQVLVPKEFEVTPDSKGWTLIFHPDLFRSYSLAHDIKQFSYFSYDVNEALHLSDDESTALTKIALSIVKECDQNIDKHTEELIVSNLGTLLKYCQRYYDRQFYTRSNVNKDHVIKFEYFLEEYFETGQYIQYGIPSVQQCGRALNLSGQYLSDLLRTQSGKSAQEHIHGYVIDRSKNMLLNSDKTISEVAFELGFNYAQSFSRLFKLKTGMSPKEYRNV